MIKATDLVKKFDDFTALKTLNTQIERGSIYGLVGSNGSGKSTFLRLIAGVYRPDGGSIQIEGADVFENMQLKDRIYFVADDLYFFAQSTVNDMADFYKGLYSNWSEEKYKKLCEIFPINPKNKISTFSKGMKRQAAIILALSTQPDYMLLDEAFDGLDPIIRTALRKLISDDIAARNATVIISSHNLRELEDLCDHVGLLHAGKILFERELDEVKLGFCKVQAAFGTAPSLEALKQHLQIMQYDTKGSLVNIIVRGDIDSTLKYINSLSPIFSEAVPLTLEEVFIHEMEAVGYDYNNIIF